MISPKLHALVKSVTFGLFVIAAGTLGYVLIEGMTPFDALYMTTITVTTIGFKEVFPLSDTGRMFTIALAFAGVGVILLIASELAGKTLAGAEVRKRFGIIVVALKRGDQSIFNPDANERIEGGDVLVALGPIAAIERVEKAVQ